MRCVNVFYIVVLNGGKGSEFKPSGGLRQGDLLSHIRIFKAAQHTKRERKIDGAKVGRGGLETKEGTLETKAVVNEYERISGQMVNFDKSLIYFSSNINEETKLQLGGELGVRIANNLEKYLGLPTMVGRRKKNAFVEIKERLLTKIKSWSNRNLSLGGKEVFIKSILHAILIYTMQCFNLQFNYVES
ncbi:reverse transcriptase [Gossypium australe]|uniref:Reverse transcriptase n=1 Tax=Gossypium australe TaxID=47621 RepID=A0A5B6WEG3_9ROSI|nr:reverse transcriptase [Gossypium australe]